MNKVQSSLINLRQATTGDDYDKINAGIWELIILLLENFPTAEDIKGQQIYIEALHLMISIKTQKLNEQVLLAFDTRFVILDGYKIKIPDNIDCVDELMRRVALDLEIDVFQHYLYLDYYIDRKIYDAVGHIVLMSIFGIDRSLMGLELLELISNSRFIVDFYEDGDEDGSYYLEIVERIYAHNSKQTNTVFKIKSFNPNIIEDNSNFIRDVIGSKFHVGTDEY